MSAGNGAEGCPPQRPTVRELLIAAFALTIVGAAVLGGHVLHGGLYTDDWPIASIYAQGGLSDLIKNVFLGDHSRPLAALYLGLAEAATGSSGHAHAIVGLGLHIFACWCLYWLLRELSFTAWEGGGIALLFLVFPFADSTWLWFAITQSSLAFALGVLGLIALTFALRPDTRRVTELHIVAVLLCVASVLTYEAAAPLIALGIVALEFTRSPRRVALIRSAVCLAALALAAFIPRIPGLLPGIEPHEGITLSQQLQHARKMAGQTMTVMTNSAMPFGAPHRNVVLPILGLLTALAAVVWVRRRRGFPAERSLRRSLGCVAAGIVVVILSYAVFINTNPGFYEPAARGEDNRINAVAALGYCLVVYGAAMLLALLLTRGSRPRLAAVIASLAIAFVALGYAHRTRADTSAWDHAATLQREELTELRSALPPLAPSTTIFAFGGVGELTPGIYVFRVTWDLDGAAELLWRDFTLHAYPIFQGTTFVCGPSALYPIGFANGNGPAQSADYGHAVFIDVRTGRRMAIRSRADCLRARNLFTPGPVT